MRIVGLAILMLLVFWSTNVWLTAFGIYWTWKDVQFALALTLFFGTIVAVPVIAYLFVAESIAALFPFPRSVFVYVAFVAFGCLLYALTLRYWKGNALPSTSEGWYYYWRGYIPLLATAAVPLLSHIVKWMRQPKKIP